MEAHATLDQKLDKEDLIVVGSMQDKMVAGSRRNTVFFYAMVRKVHKSLSNLNINGVSKFLFIKYSRAC